MAPAVAVSPISRYGDAQGIQWTSACNADVGLGLDPTNAQRNLYEKFAWYHWRWGSCRHAVSENRDFGGHKFHWDKPGVPSSEYEGGSPSTFQVRLLAAHLNGVPHVSLCATCRFALVSAMLWSTCRTESCGTRRPRRRGRMEIRCTSVHRGC